jgi:deoxyribonuclease-4
MKDLLLGAHVSIAGGVKNSILEGEKLGCTAIQIFTANNRQWSKNNIKEKDVNEYLELKKKSPIKTVVSHASYLINLGSPKKDVEAKSKEALLSEISRCNQLQIPYIVMHPGSHLKSDIYESINKISNNISSILKEHKKTSMILLENTAGQGSNIGHSFEQLSTIINKIPKELQNRVGVCFDTCHAWASGYKFDTKKTYDEMWDNFEKQIGIKKLKVIHMNNSKQECGSRKDRHEHIEKGLIPISAFRLIINDKRFEKIPKIIETPKDKPFIDDEYNLSVISKLKK